MSDLAGLFDRAATSYDAERRQLVPCFDGLYGAALGCLDPLGPTPDVLDLGAGTGLFAALIAAGRPGARLTLVDLSPAMLDRAAERFSAMRDVVPPTLLVADYAAEMPAGPFDAVVSALSIHHLPDPDKRAVLAMAYARLRPGGLFVNAEQVAGRTPAEERAFDRDWEQAAHAAGADAATIARARGRMAHDRCAPLEPQLAWLRQAGFTDVRAAWSSARFAVLAGRKPAAQPISNEASTGT